MKLPTININEEEISRLDEALRKEWLLTNGLGGYASSTILGLNTRKYHGLLVAALEPPGKRTVCLAKLDEDAIVGERIYPFNVNEFPDKIYPQGHLFQKSFSLAPFPTYDYEAEAFRVSKTLFMPQGKNATAVFYRVQGGRAPSTLRIYPLLTCRHIHSVMENHSLKINQQSNTSNVELTFNVPKVKVIVSTTEGAFVEKPNWINRLFYREEKARGESSEDNLYQPGFFEIHVTPNTVREFAIVTAASQNRDDATEILNSIGREIHDIKCLFRKELKRRTDLVSKFYAPLPQRLRFDWLSWIIQAANAFVVKGEEDESAVVAGYHWFETWGRDTFISLPGLTLVTGRFDDAKRILKSFSKHMNYGLIPNFLPDRAEEPAYNTVDATLWYLNATFQFLKYTGDFTFVNDNLWEHLKNAIKNHEKGTLFDIHMEKDGLLAHGPRLTWMDAEVEGKAVTPRDGKAVEIQALWHNALKIMEILACKFGEQNQSARYHELAETARENFNEIFWNAEKNCLFDVIDKTESDASLRPNQIFAVSLDFPLVIGERAERIVKVVRNQLLTRCGLRTLDEKDPNYRGSYVGNRSNRDQAYHNGTVWAWLTGPLTTAFLKTGNTDDKRQQAAATFIEPLLSEQVQQAGLGTISEIFDGNPPHTPRGCISQAWSVAEPLRAYVEDVMQIRPAHERDILQT